MKLEEYLKTLTITKVDEWNGQGPWIIKSISNDIVIITPANRDLADEIIETTIYDLHIEEENFYYQNEKAKGTIQKLEERIRLMEQQRDFLEEQNSLHERKIKRIEKKHQLKDELENTTNEIIRIGREQLALNNKYKHILENEELW